MSNSHHYYQPHTWYQVVPHDNLYEPQQQVLSPATPSPGIGAQYDGLSHMDGSSTEGDPRYTIHNVETKYEPSSHYDPDVILTRNPVYDPVTIASNTNSSEFKPIDLWHNLDLKHEDYNQMQLQRQRQESSTTSSYGHYEPSGYYKQWDGALRVSGSTDGEFIAPRPPPGLAPDIHYHNQIGDIYNSHHRSILHQRGTIRSSTDVLTTSNTPRRNRR